MNAAAAVYLGGIVAMCGLTALHEMPAAGVVFAVSTLVSLTMTGAWQRTATMLGALATGRREAAK